MNKVLKYKLKDIIDEIELYTVGRLKTQQVVITVEELQAIADKLKNNDKLILTRNDAEKLKLIMKERDDDASIPMNAVDKGYHLACTHLYEELDKIVDEKDAKWFIDNVENDTIIITKSDKTSNKIECHCSKCNYKNHIIGYFDNALNKYFLYKSSIPNYCENCGSPMGIPDKVGIYEN